jgi:hypothetical protein
MNTNKRITSRDREIVRFIEENNALTISQCQKIFMPTAKFGYKIAQKRLSRLVENGYLKVGRTDSSENIYYIDKKISYHDLLVNSFYAELIKCKATVLEFKHPVEWIKDEAPKSDAFFKVDYGNYIFYFILEVALTKKDVPMRSYERLCRSGIVHRQCDGHFPTLVVMDEVKHTNKSFYRSDLFKTVQIDLDLNDMPLIFV